MGPKDGRYDVLFPVFLPDESAFDWLDMFLEQHPDYTELSDRAIADWAEKSGIVRNKARTSNDKVEGGFGISMMDDGSVRRVLQVVAPIQERNYVVVELKSNLIKDGRRDLFAKWAQSGFKRSAVVMVGEPPLAFKKRGQDLTLQQKQIASDAEFKAKQAEEKHKRDVDKMTRKLERERKKAEKAAKKAHEEAQKKMEVERKKKEAKDKGEEYMETEED